MDRSATESALALSRFGLGARPEGCGVLGNAPRDALLAEIGQGDRLPDALARLPSSSRLIQTLTAHDRMTPDQRSASGPDDPLHAAFFNEIDARFNTVMMDAPIGFRERLVLFWANHFSVSYFKVSETYIMVGAYEREAIWPNVCRPFADMLLAVETHPCMLLYLDNTQSLGPQSVAGKATGRGLNENLAREILELHTLGVGSGYTQDDVTSLSRVLTGWSMNSEPAKGEVGTFIFHDVHHEPGPQTILGKTYPDAGVDQGKAVLRDLAVHPATARHIATKLARHFVSDTPPPARVARLEKTFLDTGGDLAEVSRTLVQAPECWTADRDKLRTPQEYLSAMMRLSGHRVAPQQVLDFARIMGQPNWGAEAPNGFPDTVAGWGSPAGMNTRLNVANYISYQVADIPEPGPLADRALGPLLSDGTRTSLATAESRQQALALIFMSPEFMRR